MKFKVAFSVLFVSGLLLASPLSAHDDIEIVGYQWNAKYDGTCELLYLVKNWNIGTVSEMSLSEVRKVAPAAWESLVVSQSIRWVDKSNIVWGMSTYAKQFKSKYNKIFKKHLNKDRGTPGVPKFTLGNEVVQVNGVDPRTTTDGKNIIYMTSDDRFFIGKSGTAAYMNTWFGSGGPVSLKDGKYTSPHKIVETDGFFRSDHFAAPPGYNDDLTIVHEFGHAVGFQHSPYTHDYMSYRRQSINSKNFKNKGSIVWQLNKLRDKFYYDEAYYTSQARMLPEEGTVLDITYMHAPGKGDQNLDMNAYHPLVVTNLKGHSGKKVELTVYQGHVNVAPPPAKSLFTIRGESTDYFVQMFNGYPFVRKYRLSLLNIGQEKYWKKLSKLVNKQGKKKKINGVTYNKAAQGTIKVKGCLDENQTQQRTISAKVWFVKN